jgi:hypothetical protein
MGIIQLPRNHWGWQLRREGRHWRATGPGFVNVIQSPAGFGVTPEAAISDLRRKRATSVPNLDRFIVLASPAVWTSVDGELIVEEK